jgi:AAA domain (dynein-related subfamily)
VGDLVDPQPRHMAVSKPHIAGELTVHDATPRCDGPLLEAVRRGAWVLLDELNLASQSVLEGLNAVLDHREEVRISIVGLGPLLPLGGDSMQLSQASVPPFYVSYLISRCDTGKVANS